MATAQAPNPIEVRQESGPSFTVIPGLVPYYTEIMTELTGRDAPEAQYIALATAAGGNHSQPEFNKPVDWAARVARETGKAADIIANGSEVPVMGLTSSDLRAAQTAPGSSLVVTQHDHYDFSYSAEVDSTTPVLQGSVLDARVSDTLSDHYGPTERFVVRPPGRVLTDAKDPARAVLKAEVDETLDTVHGEGILAVGEKPVTRLLDVLAKRELGDAEKVQSGFGESISLLVLAYFKEHGQQLSLSRASYIREAGRQAVSTLIASTGIYGNERSQHKSIRHIVGRLGGIEFKPEDHGQIAEGVLARMEDDETRETFATTARINGGTVEEYADLQTAGFLKGLLGVDLR